jgi:hypothetical protein
MKWAAGGTPQDEALADTLARGHNARVRRQRSLLWTWLGRRRWWIFLALAVAAIPLALFILPPVLARPQGPISEAERLEAENAVRGTLLQAIGGVVVFAGLYVTWRTFDLNRQGQVTERFTRAIDQLGKKDQLDVSLGGIYALERIARDSERDHGPVMEVLNAYVRGHTPWPPSDAKQSSSSGSFKRRPSPDVQAALRVIGRRDRDRDDKSIQLRFSDADLRGASLRGGHFEGARFRRAHLEGARLEGVHLENANLRDAHLEEADFGPDPELGLGGANLEGAHLEGANLEGAKLGGAHLKGAFCDTNTRWPEGFNPKREGVVLSTSATNGVAKGSESSQFS